MPCSYEDARVPIEMARVEVLLSDLDTRLFAKARYAKSGARSLGILAIDRFAPFQIAKTLDLPRTSGEFRTSPADWDLRRPATPPLAPPLLKCRRVANDMVGRQHYHRGVGVVPRHK